MRTRCAVLMVLALTVGACSSEPGSSQTTSIAIEASSSTGQSGFYVATHLRGFSLSPRSNAAPDFRTFLDLVAEGGTLLEWVGDGFDWTSESGTPEVTVGLAASIGVEAITIGGWTRTEDGSLLRPLTDDNVAGYVEAARGRLPPVTTQR